MNDPQDTLDQLLQEHFHRQLDPQLGRAASTFAQQIAAARAPRTQMRPRRLMIWCLWAAGAMAASVGIVWGVAVVRHPLSQPGISEQPKKPASSASSPLATAEIPIENIIAYRTLDEGPVLLDDHCPVRQLRRQVLQTVQWYDPQAKANVQITVPREQIVYVPMPSY